MVLCYLSPILSYLPYSHLYPRPTYMQIHMHTSRPLAPQTQLPLCIHPLTNNPLPSHSGLRLQSTPHHRSRIPRAGVLGAGHRAALSHGQDVVRALRAARGRADPRRQGGPRSPDLRDGPGGGNRGEQGGGGARGDGARWVQCREGGAE